MNIYTQQTRDWVAQFIVPLNICPFARKEVENNKIRYEVLNFNDDNSFYELFSQELNWLHENPETETSLIILPQLVDNFDAFLNQTGFAQQILQLEGYSGVFQLANFHPAYVFADAEEQDPANYTNRSPWPALHILREESLARAIRAHKNAEQIPVQNMRQLRELGSDEIKDLLTRIFSPGSNSC
ncbi:DUF1415 domain-containing protein [Aliidiomarina minuta]|uniref:DUF1415 domain-containing protein n=1 Tax=Aliidiomarina minuta TaxID=880057 RepID=UPI00130052DB|nr:DUF1415 domain-containing protein [Aliidiomarina minuta]